MLEILLIIVFTAAVILLVRYFIGPLWGDDDEDDLDINF